MVNYTSNNSDHDAYDCISGCSTTDLYKLIHDYKINQTLLADYLGLDKATFSRKLNPNDSLKMFLHEYQKCVKYLVVMQKDIGSVVKKYPTFLE